MRARRTWKVTITNTHAACSYHATGPTRRRAFDNACAKAGKAFLNYQVSDTDFVMAFHSCFDKCKWRIGTSHTSTNNEGSVYVRLERLP